MDIFVILQVLFDAVLLFGILFLFHFSVNQSQKKREEWDVLKNIQVQEIKENLQELLLTLKQLGKEVSDNIQEQVREAEDKTEVFEKVLVKLKRDLSKSLLLAEELNAEKKRLEDKARVVKTAKNSAIKNSSTVVGNDIDGSKNKKEILFKQVIEKTETEKNRKLYPRQNVMGFSSDLVREVYRLADEDVDFNEIVQKTKLSRAEVQLILNLRGNRFTTPN
jgi:hypothetical protein